MAGNAERLRSLFVHPDIRRKSITVSAIHEGPVRFSIEDTPFSTEIDQAQTVQLAFPEHDLWALDSPVLYTLRCELLDGDSVLETIRTPFGMREFTVREERFYFNNRPLYLKGLAFSPEFDSGDSGDGLRKQLEQVKAAGFNALRVPSAHLSPHLCTEADRLGLLIFAELPAESEALVESLRNQASIVAWLVPTRLDQVTAVEAAFAGIRALDPSRLLVGVPEDSTVSEAQLPILAPYRDSLLPSQSFQLDLSMPLTDTTKSFLNHAGDGTTLAWAPAITSVEAHLGNDDAGEGLLGANWKGIASEFERRDLAGLFLSVEDMLDAGDALTLDRVGQNLDALRCNPAIRGYCLEAISVSKLRSTTRDTRNAKGSGRKSNTFADRQNSLRLLVDLRAINLVPREEARLTVTMANEDRIEERVELSLQVIGPTGQTLWKKRRSINLPRHGKVLWEGRVAASGAPGEHSFVARILMNGVCATETIVPFHVLKAVAPFGGDINVLDPSGTWIDRCLPCVGGIALRAPIHVIPPLANTIRAYPDNELAQVMGQANDGAVVLFFSPPCDWNELAAIIDPGLAASSASNDTEQPQSYHYAKLHPVFDGLPAGRLMGAPYSNVHARKSFIEEGEEDICGALYLSRYSPDSEESSKDPWWGNNLLVKRFGSGRVVFCHLRILENLGADPVAERLFVNLLSHFARRSVPARGSLPVRQKAVEWLRKERSEHTRRWMIVGEFFGPAEDGHDTTFPPESTVDLDAAIETPVGPTRWRAWHTVSRSDHLLALSDALSPAPLGPRRSHAGTSYAYAEFASDKRGELTLELRLYCAAKIWVNEVLVGSYEDTGLCGESRAETLEVPVKLGRNSILVKASAVTGPCAFCLDWTVLPQSPKITWWR